MPTERARLAAAIARARAAAFTASSGDPYGLGGPAPVRAAILPQPASPRLARPALSTQGLDAGAPFLPSRTITGRSLASSIFLPPVVGGTEQPRSTAVPSRRPARPVAVPQVGRRPGTGRRGGAARVMAAPWPGSPLPTAVPVPAPRPPVGPRSQRQTTERIRAPFRHIPHVVGPFVAPMFGRIPDIVRAAAPLVLEGLASSVVQPGYFETGVTMGERARMAVEETARIGATRLLEQRVTPQIPTREDSIMPVAGKPIGMEVFGAPGLPGGPMVPVRGGPLAPIMPGETVPADQIVKVWTTNPAVGYPRFGKLADGRGVVQKIDGSIKTFRFPKHIVVSRNPRIRSLSRAAKRLDKLTAGLMKAPAQAKRAAARMKTVKKKK